MSATENTREAETPEAALFPDRGEREEWLRPTLLELKDLRDYLKAKRHPAREPARMTLKLAMQLVEALGGCTDAGKFRRDVAAGLRRAAAVIEQGPDSPPSPAVAVSPPSSRPTASSG